VTPATVTRAAWSGTWPRPERAGDRVSADGLSAAARRHLLALARRAIEGQLSGEPLAEEDLGELGVELERLRGAFVTLIRRKDGELRGCVGVPEPRYRLDRAVAEAAVAAAVRDRRFDPRRVLRAGRPQPARLGPRRAAPDRAGRDRGRCPRPRHSRRRSKRAAAAAGRVERGWDRERFLDETCRKAGLPPGTWRTRAASCSPSPASSSARTSRSTKGEGGATEVATPLSLRRRA
jgi:hypothetical protein